MAQQLSMGMVKRALGCETTDERRSGLIKASTEFRRRCDLEDPGLGAGRRCRSWRADPPLAVDIADGPDAEQRRKGSNWYHGCCPLLLDRVAADDRTASS